MEEMKLYLSVNFCRYLSLKKIQKVKFHFKDFLFKMFTWLSQKGLALST